MGYRSDIGLALKQSAAQRMQQKLNALDKNSDTFSVVSNLFAFADKREDADSGAEVYLWDGLKWYEDFPDVEFIESLLTELDRGDFLFIRIGEELNDIDTRGSFWDNPFELGISRSITISDPND